MSFDPILRFPVLKSRAIRTVFFNLMVLLIGSGTVYGYNALRPVLVGEGAYSEECEEGDPDCAQQRLTLNLTETTCFFIIDIAALPCGILLDMFGINLVSYWLALGYALGNAFMVLASYTNISHFYSVGLIILAGVPACSYITGLASGKMFAGKKTHIISALVALCYEVSPMFMYVMQIVVPKYMSFRAAFTGFGAITALLSITTATSHLTAEEAETIDTLHGLNDHIIDGETNESTVPVSSEPVKAVNNNENGGKTDKKERTKNYLRSRSQSAVSMTFTEQDNSDFYDALVHPRFILHCLFMMIVNTKNQFYVATFMDQIDYFADKEQSLHINKLFDVGFFLSAFLVTPFVIFILGTFKNRQDIIFMILWVLTMCHAVMNTFFVKSSVCQMIAMAIFFVLKPLKWGSSAEFLHKPPYKLSQYGRLYGIVSMSCAAGALFIYPLTRVSFLYFDGCFLTSNIILTLAEFGVGAFPIYMYYEYRTKNLGREVTRKLSETLPLLETGQMITKEGQLCKQS